MFSTLVIYSLVLVSAVIGVVALARRSTPGHRRMQLIMSFVSGLMLGIAVFHLLPHALHAATDPRNPAIEQGTGIDYVASWLMVGLVGMFLLQRLFHFHQHEFEEGSHGASHNHSHDECSVATQGNIGGVLVGLALHSMMDGVALAASLLAAYSTGESGIMFAGFGVFLAILLHKPLDAVTIDVFLGQSHITRSMRNTIVLLFSLVCPLVAFAIVAGLSIVPFGFSWIIAALAFSAGMFLCIALSDLLPEIHFHSHDRLAMTLALLLGISLSFGVKYIEADSSHHMELPTTTSATP